MKNLKKNYLYNDICENVILKNNTENEEVIKINYLILQLMP